MYLRSKCLTSVNDAADITYGMTVRPRPVLKAPGNRAVVVALRTGDCRNGFAGCLARNMEQVTAFLAGIDWQRWSGPALAGLRIVAIVVAFEDQIRTGDVVKIADIGGLVEDITLRHVRLRDYDGNVHFVPNSLITTLTKDGQAPALPLRRAAPTR